MHNFTKLVRGQAPQPGAYHNVLRMRRWLVSLDSTYGVKEWQVCFLPIETWQVCFCLSRTGRFFFLPFEDWQVCTLGLFRGLQVSFLPVTGLAGTLSVCQGTGKYVFLPFKDWQVLLLPFKELACKHTAFQTNGWYTFSAF